MDGITDYQLKLLHHTLGLRPDRREPTRNHFVAGLGHDDLRHLDDMVRAGLMKLQMTPSFLADGDMVFAATSAGIDAAVAALES